MAFLGITYNERGLLKLYMRTVANSFSLPNPERLTLLFILHRTACWGERWASIRPREFEVGAFRRKHGKKHVVVRGTGLSSLEVAEAIANLCELGAIGVEVIGSMTAYSVVENWSHADLADSPYKTWEVADSDYLFDEEADADG